LSPTGDAIFQALFGEQENENFIRPFIKSIIKRPIQKLDLTQNTIFRRKHGNDKQSVVDVLAILEEGTKVNVEMQKVSRDFSVKRFLHYWSITYERGFEKGSHYEDLNDTICILIVEGKLPELEGLPYHTIWRVKCEEDASRVLTSVLELHIIELGKLKETCGNDPELDDWLWFIADPKGEKVKKSMEQKPEIKQAMHQLRVMSEDEKMQLIAFYEDLAEHDRATEKYNKEKREQEMKQREKNIEQREKNIEQGEKDIEQGKKEIEQGKKDIEQMKKDVAQKIKEAERIEKETQKIRQEADAILKEKNTVMKEKDTVMKERDAILKEKQTMIKNMIENSIPEETIMKIANITKEELEKLKG